MTKANLQIANEIESAWDPNNTSDRITIRLSCGMRVSCDNTWLAIQNMAKKFRQNKTFGTGNTSIRKRGCARTTRTRMQAIIKEYTLEGDSDNAEAFRQLLEDTYDGNSK